MIQLLKRFHFRTGQAFKNAEEHSRSRSELAKVQLRRGTIMLVASHTLLFAGAAPSSVLVLIPAIAGIIAVLAGTNNKIRHTPEAAPP